MRLGIFISFITLLFVAHVQAQNRTLTGKIVDYEFNTVSFVSIFNKDTIKVATTDIDGNFSMTIPQNTKALIIATVGMEWKSLEVSDSCSVLEIILLPSFSYDFMTMGKVDRLRKKQFKTLPALYKSAFKKGVFKFERPCYTDRFISIKN